MIIKADLHTHTVKSFDGRQTLDQLAEAAKKKGLHAVAVTDHGQFSALPEQINGVLLIPGCEFYTDTGHITGLFMELPPELHRMTGEEAVAEIHRCGGIAVLAHPFQKAERTEEELSFDVDAIEAANARAAYKDEYAHRHAALFAKKRGLPGLGGSDAHSVQEVGNAYTEIECDTLSRNALKEAILHGKCTPVLSKNCPYRMIGLSQWERRKRMGGLKNRLIGLFFLIKCLINDTF